MAKKAAHSRQGSGAKAAMSEHGKGTRPSGSEPAPKKKGPSKAKAGSSAAARKQAPSEKGHQALPERSSALGRVVKAVASTVSSVAGSAGAIFRRDRAEKSR